MKTGYKWVAQIRPAVFFVLVFTGCATQAQLDNPPWQSVLYADHNLVGVIWDVKNEVEITPAVLLNEVERVSYLILGEKHDNPDHHKLQLKVTESKLAANTLSSISFEMMDSSVQSKLDALASQQFDTEEELKSYLQWDEEGWDWSFYSPLVQAAMEAAIPISAGNISNDTMRTVYGSETQESQTNAVSDAVMEQLISDIDESHCGLLPESQFPAMVRVQQARDSAMADSLAVPENGKASLLVAGNYHARHDLGVPNYLLAKSSNIERKDIIALSFMEVNPELLVATDYVEQTAGVLAYDYLWFTPAVSNEDYCASLREGNSK